MPFLCREKYKVLEKFEVQIPEDQLDRLEALAPAWAGYLEMLDESNLKLEKHKDNFREKVKSLLDTFLKDVSARGRACVLGWLFVLA